MIFSLGFLDSKNGSLGPFRGLGLRPRPQKEPRQPFFIISKPSGKKSNYTWKNFLHPSIEQSVKESTIQFSGLFWKFPAANKLSKSFYGHFSIAICLYFHEVSGKIIFPDTFPETYLNSTCTCHFLYHKVSGKYVSGKIFPDSWKNVMILAANHVNDYLDARVCHSLQKMLL